MEAVDPAIIRSLKKSRVRRNVLKYLRKIYPNSSYPAEIANNIDASPSNVLGALRGNSRRYKEAMSLILLGLIEDEKIGETRHYRLTSKGLLTAKALNRS
jgi:hypothetical protein